ncbi:MAG TPA: pyridoxamine 5'-phosphate oxidase family protein [Candidatus Limnocylindrales bacterium]|nr:pyridoxamine 5'-phosphate oxidase family protein [Candidatus Limnocylindrales bacterium]
MNWREFERAAPEIAESGRLRFEATHVALLGTVQRNGWPRISPVEPYFVGDDLLFGLLKSSGKARDLADNPLCTVHSSVSDVNGSEGEFKLSGLAEVVTDQTLLAADPEAWWNASNASDATVVAVDIRRAVWVAWDIAHATMRITAWTDQQGTIDEARRY